MSKWLGKLWGESAAKNWDQALKICDEIDANTKRQYAEPS